MEQQAGGGTAAGVGTAGGARRQAGAMVSGPGAGTAGWQGFPTRVDRERDGAEPFAPLRCRGFSFAFSDAPRFRIPFPQRVNLRFALHLPPGLGYPAAVTRSLRRDRCRHVISAGGRCAAFGLGTARRERGDIVWYLYVLQSDLALHGSSAVRDHLRGWRKLLFACVLNAARSEGVAALYLAPAEAVYEAARILRAYPLARVPDLWRQIYDRTAREFGMRLTEIEPGINIQSMPHRRGYTSRTFYHLPIRS